MCGAGFRANRFVHGVAVCALLVGMLLPVGASASAFGFKAGMTKDQIVAALGKGALADVDGDLYAFSTAPSPHPDFETYTCIISPEKGLLKVVANGKTIDTNDFGAGVRDQFDKVAAALTDAYGQGSLFDHLEEGSIWNEPQDWMMGLLKKDRELVEYWTHLPERGDHISAIAIETVALARDKAYLVVSYEFEGWDAYVDQKKHKQDKVF